MSLATCTIAPRRAPGGGRRGRGAVLLALLALACATEAPRAGEPSRPGARAAQGGTFARRDPQLAATLTGLAERALEARELELAEARFRRALAADPDASRARVGLGRTALARGDVDAAARHFQATLDAEPSSVPAHLGLARVAERRGEPVRVREHLERALALDPRRLEAHARLAALTGQAPRPQPQALEERLAAAARHPYDPRALLHAARGLAATGRGEQARHLLDRALLVVDRAPATLAAILAAGAELDPAWATRKVVPVHVYADEPLRGREGWRFRMRLLWRDLSASFEEILGTRFVVVSLEGFRSADVAGDELAALQAAFDAQHPSLPGRGLVAVFTGRAVPRRRGSFRLGEAQFLGRRLTVRLGEEARDDAAGPRVLAHELAHLYGGVHVSPDVASLLNPAGESRSLDPWNARILRALRARRFGPGGVEANVLPWIDLPATTRAYREILRANLALRRLGLAEAVEEGRESRYLGARRAQQAVRMDPHLGDVASFVAELLLREARPAGAAFLLRTAAQLYGPRSQAGRRALVRAQAVEATVLR